MLKKKILIDLDVITVAEWGKKDPRKKEAIDFLKKVEGKEFYTYAIDEQFEAVSKWEDKNLSKKVIRRLTEIKDEEEDATDLLEMLKLEIGRNLEKLLDEFVRFTGSKRADLRLVLIASALKVDYLVTFNRKHLKNKEKNIAEFLKKYNLHIPKIVLPGEILSSNSRIKSFSFSRPSHNNPSHLFFGPFSQFVRSSKPSHTTKLFLPIFKSFVWRFINAISEKDIKTTTNGPPYLTGIQWSNNIVKSTIFKLFGFKENLLTGVRI